MSGPVRNVSPETVVRVVGHFFVLAGFSLPCAALLSRALQLRTSFDFGFVFLIAVGGALLRRSRGAWRLAVAVAALMLLASALTFVLSLLGHAESSRLFGVQNPAPDLGALMFAATLTLALPPLILLLRPDVRRLFGTAPVPAHPGRWLIFYLVGLPVLTSGLLSFQSLVRQESISTSIRSVNTSDRRPATAAEVRLSDGGSPPNLITLLWVIGETNTAGDSQDEITVGAASFEKPSSRSWVLFPPLRAPPREANIVLVGPDGLARRVSRRVTPLNLATAEAAIAGFSDLQDLERRLLAALPPE